MTDDHRNDADDLARRIADAQAEIVPHAKTPNEANRGYSIGIEFVGTVLVAGLVGWFIDRYAGTGPWGMIVLLLIGFAAATRSVLRATKQFDGKPGEK